MARKLFSPAINASSAMVNRIKNRKADDREVIMYQVSIIKDIRRYGFETAVTYYKEEDRRFMEKFAKMSDTALKAEIERLKEKLYKL